MKVFSFGERRRCDQCGGTRQMMRVRRFDHAHGVVYPTGHLVGLFLCARCDRNRIAVQTARERGDWRPADQILADCAADDCADLCVIERAA